MERKLVMAFIFVLISGYIFAKENLAILPFTGGSGNEGETIAELFSFEPRLDEVFSLIPRTSISRAISRERGFQMDSGMTDPNTVVSIANEVGARYVVAGSITSVGNNNLLVISILDIRNLQQIAGDFQTYPQGRIENLRGRLPGMAENIIRATRNNTAALPKLAIVPVQLQGDTDRRVADTLAQLLAIHLIRSGKYAVFPRTGSLEQVQAEHDAQMSGHTADKNIIGIGHGENPDYVLSVIARRLGSVNMFNAVIINLLTRVQTVGRSIDYQDINDGMRAMEELSIVLTSSTEQIGQRQQEAAERQSEEERQRLAAERMDNFIKNSGLGLGFRAGISFNAISGEPYLIEPSLPIFFPLTAIIELKLGYFSVQTEFQYSLGKYVTGDIILIAEKGGYIIRRLRNDPTTSPEIFYFSVFQIPLLVKTTFPLGNFVISPFAGIGFNILTGFDSSNNISYRIDESDVSLPNSGIIGINAGVKLGKIVLFTDFRYIGDFGEMIAEVHFSSLDNNNNNINIFNILFSGKRSSFDISLGVSFFMPFRK